MIVNPLRRSLRTAGVVGLIVLLTPLLLVVTVIAMPAILISSIVESFAFRRFRRRHAGHKYLVWSSRHGWRDFIVNNVIPGLPNGVQAFHLRSIRHTTDEERSLRTYLYSHCHSRPYLACVRVDKIAFVPLHHALLPYRSCAARDEGMRRIAAKVIHHAIQAGQFA